MTRKHSRPPMELDLDAFLQSNDTSPSGSENEDDDNLHRSTVDELLLIDSDGSSPSSSPRSYLPPDTHRLTTHSEFSRGDTFTQLPPLFSAIRSNAKPGAALAAAAAASRSIPTPHAAAIKLRREKSSAESLDPKLGIDSESGTGSEIDHSDVATEDHNPPVSSTEVSVQVITKHDFPSMEPSMEMATDVPKVDAFDLDLGDDTLSSVAKPEIISPLINEGQVLNQEEGPDDSSDEHIDLESATSSTFGEASHADVDVDAKVVEEEPATVSVISDGDDSEKVAELGLEAQGIELKPLELAEELEKKHAFTGLHWEEGAAAQPMKLEGVHRGSTVLGYFSISTDNTITKTISSPAFRRDHGTPLALAVHLNYIAVGMSRGVIVVFPSKYSPHDPDNMDAKMLMLGLQGDRSYAPVTSMSFNQQGDLLFAGYADGHYTVWDVHKVSAAKVLTEHKAPVVHMLYLGMDSQVTRHFNVVSGDSKGVVKLIRFSSSSWLNRFSTSKTSTLLDESTSTVVCASPLVSEECSGDSTQAEEGVVIFVTHQSALVARVVSNTPEVYAQLPKPDGVREGSMPYTAWKYISPSQGSGSDNAQVKESETMALLAIAWDKKVKVAKLVKSELKIKAEWSLESSAIGVAWLDDQMLVVVTSGGHVCLYADDGSLIHKTNGDDEVAGVGHHTHFTEKAHHNCMGVRGASVYLLGPTHLVVSRLLPWKERIEALRKGGDWMGAFNMAMMLYDGQGQAHAVFDLPRTLESLQKAIMPYLVELLLAYVDEVFSYILLALGNASKDSQIKDQYTRVGGVAVEFCVRINRTDILFDVILSRFQSVQQKETFLELLEPYILKDMLGSLPPEIMQALVEHYSTKGWLQRVEQCVLHMDISSLDFNQVVRLCQEHSLYGALIYLFNKGLDDFRTPLEELLLVFRNNSAPSLGYRVLVYLKYCFSGFAFPPGHGVLPPARLPSLRMELILFLLEVSSAPSAWGLTLTLTSPEAYKNLYHLLELDTEATLDVLRCAFVDDNQHLIQKTADVLAVLLETGPPDTNWPSEDDRCHMLEFISHFVACGEAKVSKELLRVIFEYLISPTKREKEKQVLALLAHTDWDDISLLDMCQKANFYQVCGFIYNSKHQYIDAIDSFMKDADEPIHVFSYIHNLLRDKRPDSLEAAVTSRIPDLVPLSREGTVFLVVEHFSKDFQQILVELRCNLKSLFLFLKTIVEADSLSFDSLRKGEPMVKNQSDDFLQRISDFPKFLRENPLPVTDEITELYLELLCEYEPHNVLHFLESCESYRVDHCLRLCQEHGVIDAAAFLLERVGDVGTALSFTLSDVPHKFTMLHAALQTLDASSNDIIKKKEVSELLYIVYTCVGLCQRNSSRLDPNESEALWFQLLDKFCEPLSNGSEQVEIGIGSDKGLRKLVSILIKEIIEGMMGYVRLPVIMMKLLSDNGSQEFGDFKATILGMLGTYDFERRILDTARCLIEDDTYYTMRLLKRGASHGHGPRSLVCCVCNCALTSSSNSSRGIRVYSCGHASHLQCELPTSGCPVCMPKKKGIRPVQTPIHNGLVTMPLPKHKSSSQGTPAAENDALDRQISRYEILSNLDEDKRMIQIDNMPHLRLAPPAVYHEKVNKGVGQGQTTDNKMGKQIKDAKINIRFPLKSNIFGKEKTSRR